MMNTSARDPDPRYLSAGVSPTDPPLIAEAMERIRKVHAVRDWHGHVAPAIARARQALTGEA